MAMWWKSVWWKTVWWKSMIIAAPVILAIMLSPSAVAQDAHIPDRMMRLSAGAQQTVGTPRVVSLGGSVTEIIYALGAERQLVGVDQSSLYPLQAQQLPSVGYYRRLPVEGVASLRPTLVIASEHAGPSGVMEKLASLGVPTLKVSDQPTVESLHQRIRSVAAAVSRENQAEVLIQQFDDALSRARELPASGLRAMTVVMRGGKWLGAGHGTVADVVLREAGLNNVMSDQASYQPLTPESLSVMAPEVIIVTSGTVQAMGGLRAVKASPVLRATPAVQQGRVMVLDDLLAQGFGLRLPEAVRDIRQELAHVAKP